MKKLLLILIIILTLALTACQPKLDGRYNVYIDDQLYATFSTNQNKYRIYYKKGNACIIYEENTNYLVCVPKDEMRIERIGDTFPISTEN